jgi:hypothetical protein
LSGSCSSAFTSTRTTSGRYNDSLNLWTGSSNSWDYFYLKTTGVASANMTASNLTVWGYGVSGTN